jgi:hypothetical protein
VGIITEAKERDYEIKLLLNFKNSLLFRGVKQEQDYSTAFTEINETMKRYARQALC